MRWLVIGLIGLTLAAALPALAQNGAIALSSVTIELWPEYDRPTMLVQISGTLDPSVVLPAEVVIRLPAASGGPLAVATRTVAGALINTPYTTTTSGDQILVTLRADTANFHVEYYDPALTITGAARAFTFRWIPDYPVASAAVRVQAPVDSAALTGIPALLPAGPGEDGLNYYTSSWGALAAGQEARLQLSYSKSSAALSITKVTPGAATGAAAAPVSAPGLTFASPWLWGGVAAGLIVVVAATWAFWWLRTSQNDLPPGRLRRRRPVRPNHARRSDAPGDSSRAAGRAAPGQPGAIFCTQCGQRQLPGDRFCRNCGAPARE